MVRCHSTMTQNEALDILKLGHNVFLTGPAGSGKTYVLNQYIAYLKNNKIPVGITASTGIAATHIGGTTIHSWSGIGIKDEITDKDLSDLVKRQYLRRRFLQTKVLIIDEISMLHSHRLDMVDKVLKKIRGNSLPFGGMQVVFCGDFFQLPPVAKKDENADFVVKSTIWQNMPLHICYLDEQYRQDDRSFLRVLNAIRNSEVNEDTIESLSERLQKDVEGFAKPTRLFTHNMDVDKINEEQLAKLSGEEHEYYMATRGNPRIIETLQNSCLAPQKLILKKGAHVMFVKNNYEEKYVNGTLGEVIDFDSEDRPIVRTFDGDEITVKTMSWEVKEEEIELASIAQVPLRLAWAITIHKSQGMSLDAAEVDLSRSFLPGMGYVALSRVRNLKGLKLLGINNMALVVHPEVSELDREFVKKSNEAILYLSKIPKEKKQQTQEDVLKYMKGVNLLEL